MFYDFYFYFLPLSKFFYDKLKFDDWKIAENFRDFYFGKNAFFIKKMAWKVEIFKPQVCISNRSQDMAAQSFDFSKFWRKMVVTFERVVRFDFCWRIWNQRIKIYIMTCIILQNSAKKIFDENQEFSKAYTLKKCRFLWNFFLLNFQVLYMLLYRFWYADFKFVDKNQIRPPV